MAMIGKSAPKNDFNIKPVFDLFSSSSSEPSNTINIKPMVPNIGRIEVRSGKLILSKEVICFTTHPSNKSKITEGIFVLSEVISNRYAISRRIQKVMITADVIVH